MRVSSNRARRITYASTPNRLRSASTDAEQHPVRRRPGELQSGARRRALPACCPSAYRAIETGQSTSGADPDRGLKDQGSTRVIPDGADVDSARTVQSMTNLETEPAPLPPPSPGPYPTSDAGHDPTIGSCSVSQAALAVLSPSSRCSYGSPSSCSHCSVASASSSTSPALRCWPTRPPPIRRAPSGASSELPPSLLSARGCSAATPSSRTPAGWSQLRLSAWPSRCGPVDQRSDTATLPPQSDVATATDGGSTSDRWSSLTHARRDRPRPPRSPLGLLTVGAATVIGALGVARRQYSGTAARWLSGGRQS